MTVILNLLLYIKQIVDLLWSFPSSKLKMHACCSMSGNELESINCTYKTQLRHVRVPFLAQSLAEARLHLNIAGSRSGQTQLEDFGLSVFR